MRCARRPPAEDGAAQSWAGQLTSVLPAEPSELSAAIERVRRSGATETARAYGDAGDIPVLVQEIVDATAAGVAFSLDPRDGNEHRCVIEAVAGLGTAVTDGSVTPSRWTLPLEGGCLDGPGDGLLDSVALEAVRALTLAVAEWLGRPCDLEFAWDGECAWLLQARPITAATWAPAPGQWTAANFRENVPGVVSPMASSINFEGLVPESVDAVLRRAGLARPDERVCEGRRFYGHVYWRVDLLKERLLRLPGFSEASFDATVGIASGGGRRSPVTPRGVAQALPALRALVGMFLRVGAVGRAFARQQAVDEGAWLAVRWDELDDGVLARRLADARALHRASYRHSLLATFLAEQAQDALRELIDHVGKPLESPVDVGLLLSGDGEVATDAAARRLEALGARYASAAGEILAAKRLDELPPDARAELASVIERYGWMAVADDELAQTRWDEDERLPLALFKAAVRAATAGAAGNGAARATRRAAEERRVLRAAGALRPLLVCVLRVARRWQVLREELRVCAGRGNRILRRALLAQSRRWARQGVLASADQLFWLTAHDLDALLAGTLQPAAARERAAGRRRHALRFRSWDAPSCLAPSRPAARPPRAATVAC